MDQNYFSIKREPNLPTARSNSHFDENSGESSTTMTQNMNPLAATSVKKRRVTRTIERGDIDARLSDDVLVLVGGSWMIPKSCDGCRKRRLFCDRRQPCGQCTTKGTRCDRPSGFAPAKRYSRRFWSLEPGKHAHIDYEEKEQKTTQTNAFNDEGQDQSQISTSNNSPFTPFSPQATVSPGDTFTQLAHSMTPSALQHLTPAAPVVPIARMNSITPPIADDISLMTRITTSREARRIYEREASSFPLFLEQVRRQWKLAATERIVHVQVMITMKLDTNPMTQAIDINLENPSQWDVVMNLIRLHDKTGVVIVEIN